MTRVFISYRRSDAAGHAGRVADRLRAHASAPDVFFDTSDIDAGRAWRQSIEDALAACEVMLVAIGPRWLATPEGAAQPRLFEPDDLVAHEVETGLTRGVRVIQQLLDGTNLPAREQLPPRRAGLLGQQEYAIGDKSFDRDIRDLERRILPRVRPPWLVPAAVGAVVVAGAAAWLLQPAAPVVPGAGAAASAPVVAVGAPLDLDVDVAFVPHEAMELLGLPSNSIVLLPERPRPRGPLLLRREGQAAGGGGPLRFVHEKFELPRAGNRFTGTMVRHVDSAVKLDTRNNGAVRTAVCFDVTGAAPPADGRLHLACREGEACVPEPPGVAGPCSGAGPSLRWPDLMPSAIAQTAAPAIASKPAPGDWLAPRLESLRQPGGNARVGFSELTLTLVAPPEAATADEVAHEVSVNGRRLWVNGLPAWADAQPRGAGPATQVVFGLENLDSSGADRGREQLLVRVLWLRDKQALAEDRVTLPFTALRTLAEAGATTARGAAVRWKASYLPAPSDRYQILVFGGNERDTLAAKPSFDRAQVPARAAGLKLVGVVRPPNRGNANWGLAVGEALASGQVRFSFPGDDARGLCRLMERESARLRAFGTPAAFGVREIALEGAADAQRKPVVPCRAF